MKKGGTMKLLKMACIVSIACTFAVHGTQNNNSNALQLNTIYHHQGALQQRHTTADAGYGRLGAAG